MAIKTAQVQVGTTPVQITTENPRPMAEVARVGAGGYAHTIAIRTEADIYVGGPDVTTENGWQVKAGEVASFELYEGDDLWARTSAGTSLVHVINLGV